VLNLARAHFRREKMRIADEAPNSPMIEEGQCRRVDQPHEAAIEREIRQLLPELLHRLDAEFGRGTRTIVEFRNQGVAWARITNIVGLQERACRYRLEQATQWLSKRLSLQANPRSGGSHD